MRSTRAQLSLLTLVVHTSMASGAPAVGDVRTIELDLQSDAGCVSQAALIEGVQKRTPRISFVERGGDRTVRVSFARTRSGQVKGELALVRKQEHSVLRQVVAASCADATDAMALILAITLDPDAAQTTTDTTPNSDTSLTPPPPPPTQSSASDSTASLSPIDGFAPRTASATTPGERPNESAPVVNEVRRDNESVLAHDELWSFGAALGGESSFGPAPSMLGGLRAQLLFATERQSAWSPAVLVGGVVTWSSLAREVEGNASFALQALTMDLCGVRVAAGVLELRACGELFGGRLSATASNTRNSAGTVSRPFVSVGGLASIHARPTKYFEITARVAALGNLVRDEFTFTPRVFHSVAPVTLSLGLLAGFRLPYSY